MAPRKRSEIRSKSVVLGITTEQRHSALSPEPFSQHQTWGGLSFGVYDRNDKGRWIVPEFALTAAAIIIPEPTHASLLVGALGLLAARRRRSCR